MNTLNTIKASEHVTTGQALVTLFNHAIQQARETAIKHEMMRTFEADKAINVTSNYILFGKV